VGAVVADLRHSAGLDQAAVAAHLGIDQPAMSRIERGERRLNAWELAALAELLQVEPGVLTAREQPAAVLMRTAGAERPAIHEALAAFEVVMREVLAARALEELL
jgi:transcriptional regulator with XRE-family HTH domain